MHSGLHSKFSFLEKYSCFSLKTAKTALYHSIKCGNLAESQGFEEPSFGTYALFSCYHMPFHPKQREILNI